MGALTWSIHRFRAHVMAVRDVSAEEIERLFESAEEIDSGPGVYHLRLGEVWVDLVLGDKPFVRVDAWSGGELGRAILAVEGVLA